MGAQEPLVDTAFSRYASLAKENHMHWGPGIGWGEVICFGTIGLVLLAGLIAFIIWLLTSTSSRSRTSTGGGTKPPPSAPPKTPMEILKERYARGEITQEEYLEMREHLREE
jgi:putative membrane protein